MWTELALALATNLVSWLLELSLASGWGRLPKAQKSVFASDLAERIKHAIQRDIQHSVAALAQNATAQAAAPAQPQQPEQPRNSSILDRLPVVFLAFAGVAVGDYIPLPRVGDEARKLRQIWDGVQRAGQCILVLRTEVTLDDILEVFADSRYRDRIKVFHFAGHADSVHMLMEAAAGKPLLADAQGFAEFLALQPGLQLVFLNACCTQEEAAALQKRGRVDVIATTEDVDDELALSFAVRFHTLLAGGAPAPAAFDRAAAAEKIDHPGSGEWPWRFSPAVRPSARPLLARQDNLWFVPISSSSVVVGRDADVQDLHTLLNPVAAEPRRTNRPVGIYGMGGIGKTRLALAYCHLHRHDYADGVFWLGSAADWDDNLAQMVAELGPDWAAAAASERQEDKIRAAFTYLSMHSDYLLVLDNVPSTSVLTRPYIGSFIFSELPGHVLYTMRSAGPRDWQQHKLRRLAEPAALQLLLRSAARRPILEPAHPEHGEAQTICRMFGGLPLALEIAGAFLDDNASIPLADFRKRLKLEGSLATLDREGRYLTDSEWNEIHAVAVAATLREQWQILRPEEEVDEIARSILCVAAQLPEAMSLPSERLRLMAGVDDDPESGEPSQFARALQRLDRLSLLEDIGSAEVQVHPLIRDFAAKQIPNMQPVAFRRQCAQRLWTAYTQIDKVAHQCAQRGIDAVEQDVLAALALLSDERQAGSAPEPDAETAKTGLAMLLRFLQHETHTLRAWQADKDPLRFWQQWRKRALIERQPVHAEAAHQRIVAQPAAYLDIKWLISQESTSLRRTLAGHLSTVRFVTVSPDGRRAVSVSRDAAAIVWDLEKGGILHPLAGHEDWVRTAAMTPDGRLAITGSKDLTLKVWDVETAECLRTLVGHTGWVRTVTVTPNGRYIVSGSEDHSVRIWDIQDDYRERILEGHKSWINAIAVTADSRLAVSASNDTNLIVWDLATGERLRVLSGHSDGVRAAAIVPGKNQVVSASDDKTLRVWDLTGNADPRILIGHTQAVKVVVCTADGKQAVSGSYDHTVRVWELQSGSSHLLAGHRGAVNSLCLIPGRPLAVSAAADATLKIWNLAEKCEDRTLIGHALSARCVAVTPDGRTLVSASQDLTLKLWDIGDEKIAVSYNSGHTRAINQIAVAASGRRVVSASEDHTLRVWDAATGQEQLILSGHTGAVNAAAITHDSRYVISASEDRTLRAWRLPTGEPLPPLAGHSDAVNHVVVTATDQYAVFCTRDGALRVWRLGGQEPPLTLAGHGAEVRALALLPNGESVITGDAQGAVKLWRIGGGEEPVTLGRHKEPVQSVTLLPGSALAVTAASNGVMKLWQLAARQEQQMWQGHKGQVNAVAAHPDGRRLFSAAGDGSVMRWEIGQTGAGKPLIEGQRPMVGLAVTLDGNCLIAATDKGSIFLFGLVAEEQVGAIDLDYPVRCLALAQDDALCYVGDENGNLYALEFRI